MGDRQPNSGRDRTRARKEHGSIAQHREVVAQYPCSCGRDRAGPRFRKRVPQISLNAEVVVDEVSGGGSGREAARWISPWNSRASSAPLPKIEPLYPPKQIADQLLATSLGKLPLARIRRAPKLSTCCPKVVETFLPEPRLDPNSSNVANGGQIWPKGSPILCRDRPIWVESRPHLGSQGNVFDNFGATFGQLRSSPGPPGQERAASNFSTTFG